MHAYTSEQTAVDTKLLDEEGPFSLGVFVQQFRVKNSCGDGLCARLRGALLRLSLLYETTRQTASAAVIATVCGGKALSLLLTKGVCECGHRVEKVRRPKCPKATRTRSPL